MRKVNNTLFEKLKARAIMLPTCWLITRQDGEKFGFTSHDKEFVYEGVTFFPENGIAADATASKNDFSSSNSSATVVFSQNINEHDVRIGKFDYAEAKSFWIDPDHPEQGIIPIQKGYLGEITIKNNQFEVELRSLLDLLQLPFGRQYNLECDARLGDSRCGYPMQAQTWTPNTKFTASIPDDARFGAIIKPTVDNGFWYLCVDGAQSATATFPRGTTYAGLGPDPFVGTGINPFNGFGPIWGVFMAQWFQALLSTPSTTPGTTNVIQVTIKGGNTGATEPVWPTTLGATVVDGQVTWKAIPSRIPTGVVTGPISRTQFQDSTRWEATQTFQYGVLTWLTGENAGRSTEVRGYDLSSGPAMFTLLEVMPCPIQAGDTYSVTVGCGKTRAHCKNKFSNMLNFRGFPDMPTEDRALSTPNFSMSQNLTFSQDSGGGKK